ncbi:MAG: transcriptional repressor [Deltaproteobacteria bacterium]|jgi:Fur family zinc uptake transcriptional regulator|nr:transcriptional repressor [Deltaproteobacteria bacterium]
MSPNDETLKKNLDRLADQCAARGVHLTNLRRLLMGLLLTAEKPVKAYELIERSALQGRRLTPATVYRVLDFLIEHGLVHKVNAINAFVACSDYEGALEHHPLILVCPACQKTTEINDPDLSIMVFGKLNSLGYSLKSGSIEIHGHCGLCAEKSPPEST